MIIVKDLHKSFEDNQVLKGVNYHIHPGEKIVVVGPSGSGKSTFLRCLNRLEEPDGGEVIFKKYSLIGGLEEFAAQFCDTLSRSTDFSAAITDRDAVIAISGAGKKELLGKSVSPELEQVMTRRSLYCGDGVPVAEGNGAFRAAVAAPILCEGDVLGAVLFLSPDDHPAGETECKLAQTVATFLGKNMES